MTDTVCAAPHWTGGVGSAPEPAWGRVRASLDKCWAIPHNRPQNQFEAPSIALWYISLIWRNQFKVSLCWSDGCRHLDVVGETSEIHAPFISALRCGPCCPLSSTRGDAGQIPARNERTLESNSLWFNQLQMTGCCLKWAFSDKPSWSCVGRVQFRCFFVGDVLCSHLLFQFLNGLTRFAATTSPLLLQEGLQPCSPDAAARGQVSEAYVGCEITRRDACLSAWQPSDDATDFLIYFKLTYLTHHCCNLNVSTDKCKKSRKMLIRINLYPHNHKRSPVSS